MNNHPKPPPPTPSSASATSLAPPPPRTITLNRPILVAAFPSPPIYSRFIAATTSCLHPHQPTLKLRRGPTKAPARTLFGSFHHLLQPNYQEPRLQRRKL